MNTASTSSSSLGGPKRVPRSWARRKTIFPVFSSKLDMGSLLWVRDANDFTCPGADCNVIKTDWPPGDEGGSKHVEHVCASWCVLVGTQLESERAQRFLCELHDHFT